MNQRKVLFSLVACLWLFAIATLHAANSQAVQHSLNGVVATVTDTAPTTPEEYQNAINYAQGVADQELRFFIMNYYMNMASTSSWSHAHSKIKEEISDQLDSLLQITDPNALNGTITHTLIPGPPEDLMSVTVTTGLWTLIDAYDRVESVLSALATVEENHSDDDGGNTGDDPNGGDDPDGDGGGDGDGGDGGNTGDDPNGGCDPGGCDPGGPPN